MMLAVMNYINEICMVSWGDLVVTVIYVVDLSNMSSYCFDTSDTAVLRGTRENVDLSSMVSPVFSFL